MARTGHGETRLTSDLYGKGMRPHVPKSETGWMQLVAAMCIVAVALAWAMLAIAFPGP
jgi:hypothetical protein